MNTLREAVHEYLRLRRILGFKLHQTGNGLLDFVTFMEQRQAPFITECLALDWATQPVNVLPSRWATRLTYVRVFARYRKASDPRTEIPSPELLPHKAERAKPYLYSDEEICSLLQAALSMSFRYKECALLPWTYYCLFGLLSVTGLRLGEALNLALADVDLDAALLTARRAKHERSRLVPLHTSTCEVLAEYIARRERHWRGRAVSSWLFVSSRGNQHDSRTVQRTFKRLSRQIGLGGTGERRGPRLHDMRHTFATTTLVNCYRRDQDPERLLPVLSTWLGHVLVRDTYWYLEASPELMREAMTRLENFWEDRS
ncbi:MAG: tyrosine-type recombinase/integrase [Chloroflexi bacterium]|nr:tyrosine-type recombinase/integrase [Chloroflexota bacterium]